MKISNDFEVGISEEKHTGLSCDLMKREAPPASIQLEVNLGKESKLK